MTTRWRMTFGTLLVLIVLAGVGVSGVLAQAFDVDAPSAILLEAATGQVLYEKNADEAFPPASLVKVMTLLVAMDAAKMGEVNLEDPVRTSETAAQMTGSRAYLSPGETHSFEKMLRAVAIAGANDASVAVAEFVAGTEAAFVNRMNERAQQLGLSNTVFTNSHGLDLDERSWISARDIALVTQELVVRHPEVLEWTSVRVENFREEPLFNLYNTNNLVGRYSGLDGLRTGFTSEAGYSLAATAERNDVRLISVILAAESEDQRYQQTTALLDYGFNRFVPVTVATGTVGEIRVPNAASESIPIEVTEPVRVLARREAQGAVVGRIVRDEAVRAPLEQGDRVGEYVVEIEGQEVMRVPVYAAEDVDAAGLFLRIWRGIRDFGRNLIGRGN